MRKTKIWERIAALISAVVFVFALIPKSRAEAAEMTLDAIGALAFAISKDSGINFEFDIGSGPLDAQEQMCMKLTDFMAGRTITEVFGDQLINKYGSRIVIGHLAYNGIREFLNEIVEDFDLLTSDATVFKGKAAGQYIDLQISDNEVKSTGISVTWNLPTGVPFAGSYWIYNNAVLSGEYQLPMTGGTQAFVIGWGISDVQVSYTDVRIAWVRYRNGQPYSSHVSTQRVYAQYTVSGAAVGSIPDDYSDQTITSTQDWAGSFPGIDTSGSLDDMIEDIYDHVADNDLAVVGEVIEHVEPTPQPTPVPTYPPAETVLDGVNTIINQGNDTLQDLNDINITAGGVLEGINDLIGVDEGVAEDVSDIAGTAEEVLEGIDNIGNDVGGIATDVDGIATDVGGIATDVGDIAGELEGVGEGVADIADTVGDIADALQPTEIQTQRIDLRTLFPFCIPFDIYRLLSKFDASPQAPHVQLPLVIQSIGFRYVLDLDFSPFNPLAQAVRTVELIIYALGLAWATSKVIKW